MSYPNSTSGGPPLRALAMVLIALAIVFAGLGAMSMSNSEATSNSDAVDNGASATSASAVTSSATAAPQVPAGTTAPKPTAAASTTAAATTTGSSAAATTTPAVRSVPVRVLNNSMIAGLASKTANELSASGWTIAETGNFPGANIPKTTVYYGTSPGDRDAAQAIADELGAAIAPKSGIGDSSPGVTVVVTGN